MRVMITARAAIGHFRRPIALAQAAHDVAGAMPSPIAAMVERLGFRCLAAGLDESSPEYLRFIEERNRLHGRERARFMRSGAAGSLGRRMTSDIIGISEAWRPDLFVRDESDVFAQLAVMTARSGARQAAVPQASWSDHVGV